MNIINSIKESIGNTPLVRASSSNGSGAEILLKIEAMNPSGSVKDRAALYMLEDAKKRSLIKRGSTVIEPTSGNTGIGLAMISAVEGYKLILVMPDSMSVERVKTFKAYGAQVVLTPSAEGMSGTLKKAQELGKSIPDSFIPQQFSNPANRRAHEETTATELWRDCGGNIDAVVAGVGTGGTLCGIARAIKKLNPDFKAVAVEPSDSPMLSEGRAGSHKIQGIGANFVPEIYQSELVDEIITVDSDAAAEAARKLAREDGILVGISSGAAMCAAQKLAARPEFKGKRIVAILPDSGSRYLSTWLFE